MNKMSNKIEFEFDISESIAKGLVNLNYQLIEFGKSMTKFCENKSKECMNTHDLKNGIKFELDRRLFQVWVKTLYAFQISAVSGNFDTLQQLEKMVHNKAVEMIKEIESKETNIN
jgi:hypothetical protein